MRVLSEQDWHCQSRNLKKRIDGKLRKYFTNRSQSTKNPIVDFLFEYYSFRFAELKCWSPGVGVILTGESTQSFLKNPMYKKMGKGVTLDTDQISIKRQNSIKWIIDLLERTKERTAYLGCLGLHEWAMVYKQQKTRHNISLRMTPTQIQHFVENSSICCSHYDAYRFFTKEAINFNELKPTKQTRHQYEQPGCLHTNMDLYKWAHKFYPWINSELIADTFELAWEIREVDMRASPYDIQHLGYKPILIETSEGRQQYIAFQKEFSNKAAPLRQRLIDEYQKLLQMLNYDFAKTKA
ncbi:3-methyladenine DNA glycosylase [Candidatus Uabimicrobium sp. HlEnr_7]|uniref:3-methyladenine DNA glycosylase n=1 Tax=Candidatus Uabimicrobium helgolandensis TaxID=3095367 RepID=UPI0035563B25